MPIFFWCLQSPRRPVGQVQQFLSLDVWLTYKWSKFAPSQPLTDFWLSPFKTNLFFSRFQLAISAATSKVLRRDSEFLKFDSFSTKTESECDESCATLSDFENLVEVSGTEKLCYNFTKLPEIIGSGHPYLVQIKVVAFSAREVCGFSSWKPHSFIHSFIETHSIKNR